MSDRPRPIVVISKCLGFAACRYDGGINLSSHVGSMEPFVDFIDVCPECEIGLGVPREPVILVENGEKKIIQPATGTDLTDRMKAFADSYLKELDDFDGFILKAKSPSCALGTCKVYLSADSTEWVHRQGSGFFADAVLRDYPHLPSIDELDLENPLKRDHFLTRIFTLASFRETAKLRTISDLIDFHARNKLLFMAYDQEILNEMGNVVANKGGRKVDEVYDLYLQHLLNLLSEPAEPGSVINAMMHAFGYFSRKLSASEKFMFLNKLQNYREDNSVLFGLRKSFLSRAREFELDYLRMQTFFSPYPPELGNLQ